MLYYYRTDISEKIDVNFKILYVMVIIMRQCCVLIKAILLLSLLTMLITVSLLMALANLKQFIY